VIPAGELVADASWMNEVPRARNWFTPSLMQTTTRMRQTAVVADLNLHPISLPNTCNKAEAKRLGAKHVSKVMSVTKFLMKSPVVPRWITLKRTKTDSTATAIPAAASWMTAPLTLKRAALITCKISNVPLSFFLLVSCVVVCALLLPLSQTFYS
jgi:hypothetical protein